MRALALSRSWALTALVFALSLVPLGVEMVRPCPLRPRTRAAPCSRVARCRQWLFCYHQNGVVSPVYACEQNFVKPVPHAVTVK